MSEEDLTSLTTFEEDKVDFIISGLVYEPEREPTYNASLSYLSVEYYLVEVD